MNTCSLLINHSHHSIHDPSLVFLIMTLWQPFTVDGWIVQHRENFYRILERQAQRQSCYSTTHEGRSFPRFLEKEERGRRVLTFLRRRSYVRAAISTTIAPPLFMNIFHRRNFLLVTFPDRLSFARSRITVVSSRRRLGSVSLYRHSLYRPI